MNSVRSIFKFAAATLSVSLFTTNSLLAYSVESNFQINRRQFPDIAPLIDALPPRLGNIQAVSRPAGAGEGVVLFLQDVHRNAEAQKNLGAVVQRWIEQNRDGVVALEGAVPGYSFNLEYVHRSPYQNGIRKAADALLKANEISGPIHAGLTSSAPFSGFVGVDDPFHYEANVKAVRDSWKSRLPLKTGLQAEAASLAREKQEIFNRPLLEFDERARTYRAGKIPLGAYAKTLLASAGKSVAAPSVDQFVAALSLEERLNQPQVEAERARLIGQLTARLNPAEAKNLLTAGACLRQGSLTSADFYAGLQTLCEKNGVALDRFPAIRSYIRYILLTGRLSSKNIFREISALEKRSYETLVKNDRERELLNRAGRVDLQIKLVDFSLTNEEWTDYKEAHAGKPGLETFEAFYREAEARGGLIVANLLKAMKTRRATRAILVAGGFHNEEIVAGLNQAGLSVVTFSPKITTIDTENASAYLSVFCQEKTPLEKLFEGEKLFLAPHPEPVAIRDEKLPNLVAGEENLKYPGSVNPADVLKSLSPQASKENAPLADRLSSWLKWLQALFRRSPAFDGEGLELYDRVYNRAQGVNLVLAGDIAEAGEQWAAAILRAWQDLMFDSHGNPTKGPILTNFCTGDTPWVGYGILLHWLKNWSDPETQRFLRKYGVRTELKLKPDMTRVLARPLDSLFPQKRDAYYSFVFQLDKFFDELKIPNGNRSYFYGDLIIGDNGKLQQMTEEEYIALLMDVKHAGLLVTEYLKSKSDAHHSPELMRDHPLQVRHFQAMEKQAEQLSKDIELRGGAQLTLLGVGPSYDGFGHIAFLEKGKPVDQKAFIDTAVHHVLAGQAKENGGLANLTSDNGLPTIGVTSFGYADLFFRGRHGRKQYVVAMGTNNNKSKSIQRALEEPGDPSLAPLSVLQELNPESGNRLGTLIMDRASADKLRLQTNPWEFQIIDKWTPELVKKLFLQLSLEYNKEISELTAEDFYKQPIPGDAGGAARIRQIRKRNYDALVTNKPWEKHRKNVIESLLGQLVDPQTAMDRLDFHSNDVVLMINPHLDDEYLAMPDLIRQMTRRSANVYATYLAAGYTAVHDDYVFELLKRIDLLTDEEIEKRPDLKTVTTKLAQLVRKRSLRISGGNGRDLHPWRQMSAYEQKLRASALLCQLQSWMHAQKLEGSARETRDLIDWIRRVTKTKPAWGAVDIELMQKIKTWIRGTSNTSAMMTLGLKFENIFPPMDVDWYGSQGRGLTASDNDLDKVRKIIAEKKPRFIISNGEKFSDAGAHATTELSTTLALDALIADGTINPESTKYLQYAGVWYRIPFGEAALSVTLSRKETRLNRKEFPEVFPDQATAPVPDPATPALNFFSDQVFQNGELGAKEVLGAIGSNLPVDMKTRLEEKESNVLNFRVIDLKNTAALHEQAESLREELERIREAKKRGSNTALQGAIPQPAGLIQEQQALKESNRRLFYALKNMGKPPAELLPPHRNGVRDNTPDSSLYAQQINHTREFLREFRPLTARLQIIPDNEEEPRVRLDLEKGFTTVPQSFLEKAQAGELGLHTPPGEDPVERALLIVALQSGFQQHHWNHENTPVSTEQKTKWHEEAMNAFPLSSRGPRQELLADYRNRFLPNFEDEATFEKATTAVRAVVKAARQLNATTEEIIRLTQPDWIYRFEFNVRLVSGKDLTLVGYRVQHSDLLGPYKGGLRFAPIDLDKVLDLALEMVVKCSLVQVTALLPLAFGGAKGGANVDLRALSKSDPKNFNENLSRIMDAFSMKLETLHAVGPHLDIPAPDMGTITLMAQFVERSIREKTRTGRLGRYAELVELLSLPPNTNFPFVNRYNELLLQGKLDAADQDALAVVTGKPIDQGGLPGRTEATGRGVVLKIENILRSIGKPGLQGKKVAIQGLGNVGFYTAHLLIQAGAIITSVGELGGIVTNENGIDVVALKEHMQTHQSVSGFKGGTISEGVPGINALFVEGAQILIPAAGDKQITGENVHHIKASALLYVEAANGPTTPEAEEWMLNNRPYLIVIPDIWANADGVGVSYLEWLSDLGLLFPEFLGKILTADDIDKIRDWVFAIQDEMNFSTTDKVIRELREFSQLHPNTRSTYRASANRISVGRWLEEFRSRRKHQNGKSLSLDQLARLALPPPLSPVTIATLPSLETHQWMSGQMTPLAQEFQYRYLPWVSLVFITLITAAVLCSCEFSSRHIFIASIGLFLTLYPAARYFSRDFFIARHKINPKTKRPYTERERKEMIEATDLINMVFQFSLLKCVFIEGALMPALIALIGAPGALFLAAAILPAMAIRPLLLSARRHDRHNEESDAPASLPEGTNKKIKRLMDASHQQIEALRELIRLALENSLTLWQEKSIVKFLLARLENEKESDAHKSTALIFAGRYAVRLEGLEQLNFIRKFVGLIKNSKATLLPLYLNQSALHFDDVSNKSFQQEIAASWFRESQHWEHLLRGHPENIAHVVNLALHMVAAVTPGKFSPAEQNWLCDFVVRFYPVAGSLLGEIKNKLWMSKVLPEAETRRLARSPETILRDATPPHLTTGLWNGEKFEVLGKLDLPAAINHVPTSPGLVKTPLWTLQIRQPDGSYADTLQPNSYMDFLSVIQDGRKVHFHPAKIAASNGESWELMLCLGQYVKPEELKESKDNFPEPRIDSPMHYPDSGTTIRRRWIPWKIGKNWFRYPVNEFSINQRNNEGGVALLGYTSDAAVYRFQTDVIFKVYFSPAQHLAYGRRLLRDSTYPNPIDHKKQSLEFSKRAKLVDDIRARLNKLRPEDRDGIVIDFDKYTAVRLQDLLEEENPLSQQLFKKHQAVSLKPDKLLARISFALLKNDSAKLHDALETVTGGVFVPSLGVVLSQTDGIAWLLETGVSLAQEERPWLPKTEILLSILKRGSPFGDVDQAAELFFQWLSVDPRLLRHRADVLSHFLITSEERLATMLAFGTYLPANHGAPLLTFKTNAKLGRLANYLGDTLKLATPIQLTKMADLESSFFVRVTIKGLSNVKRSVYAGNAGPSKTVFDVVESLIPLSSARMAKKIESYLIERPGEPIPLLADEPTKLIPGDSLIVSMNAFLDKALKEEPGFNRDIRHLNNRLLTIPLADYFSQSAAQKKSATIAVVDSAMSDHVIDSVVKMTVARHQINGSSVFLAPNEKLALKIKNIIGGTAKNEVKIILYADDLTDKIDENIQGFSNVHLLASRETALRIKATGLPSKWRENAVILLIDEALNVTPTTIDGMAVIISKQA